MTLTELRYIVALARERHFGRAAERCFVSQPTLSVAVRKLEEELGVALFERSKQEIALTPVGREVVAQAQRVLEETERVRQLAESGKDPLAGPLRLGVIYTIGPYLLPHLIPILHERAPRMPLAIEEGFTVRLSERLRNGELDVIVVSLPFREPGVLTQVVYREPFVVLVSASHPWTQLNAVEPDSLADEELLLLGEGHCFRDQVLELCPRCHRSAGAGGRAQTLGGGSLETIRHMVASGMGVTVLPCTAAGADLYSQRLIAIRRFVPPAPERAVILAWRRSFTRPATVELLRQAVLSCGLSCARMCPDARVEGGAERPAQS